MKFAWLRPTALIPMGMFDLIKCSANIAQLTNLECQTKDLDNLFGFYWVDPSGCLWHPDYSATYDIKVSNSEVRSVSSGLNGKMRPYIYTGDIKIGESKTSPDGYVDWVECKLTFVEGKLKDFIYINNYTKK